MNGTKTVRKLQQGFTLVELAIVMIIIGLLIGGILKGQELIANARVTSTVAQVKGIDAATSTFQDKFNGLPGDLVAANTRLPPDCDNAGALGACVAGDGNGQLASAPGAAPGVEAQQFFQQLSAADLLNGIQVTQGNVLGGYYPQANIAGGFGVGYTTGGAALTNGLAIAAADVRSGHYLVLAVAPQAALPATGPLTANQASRIDTKLDDGNPASGSVFPGGAGACINGAVYNEATDQATCDLYIRFHQ